MREGGAQLNLELPLPVLQAKESREFVGFAVLATFATAVLADVLNDHKIACTILTFLTGVGAVMTFSAWIDFSRKIYEGQHGAAKLKLDEGTYITILVWFVAWAAAWLHWRRPDVLREPKCAVPPRARSRTSRPSIVSACAQHPARSGRHS